MMRLSLGAGFLLAAWAAASADEVVLHNGAVFSGRVREQGNRVVVEMDAGSMSFLRVDVKEVRKTGDPLREFEVRARLATGTADKVEAARWARENGLPHKATELLRKAVEQDPDQAEARRLLGFEKVGDRWLEGDDLQIARGLLKHQGRWLPRETVEALKAQEARMALEVERRQSEEKIAGMRREIEWARVALERERLERDLDRDRIWAVWTLWPTRMPCPPKPPADPAVPKKKEPSGKSGKP
jgi:hypothetical protein